MTIHDKIDAIFRELVGDRADALRGSAVARDASAAVAQALLADLGEERAQDVAFHMTDWNSDAAFIVALFLFPERFTPNEIREGLESFFIHAPNHIAAAAKLGGHPISDIFQVGALEAAGASRTAG